MNSKQKILGTALTAGAALASLAVVQSDFRPHYALADNQTEQSTTEENIEQSEKPKEVEPESIQLNPGMYIPEESTLRNQKVDKDDVIKTLNLGPLRLSKNSALAEISAGIEAHLGRSEDTLSYDRITEYSQSVIQYAGLVQETFEVAIEPDEIEVVLSDFREWVEGYKTEIEEEIAEKARVEEERLQRELKAQQQSNTTVPDSEVVQSTMNESKITLTDHIKYSLPNLGDEYLTYMPYTAITARTTPHWRLQQVATTNSEGYRVYEDAICIALASSYGTQIGTIYEITFEDGKSMRAILADNKSDKHTDVNKQYRDAREKYDGVSGNIVEIVFDTKGYDGMNAVNRKINSDYPSHVKSITKVGIAKGFEK